MIKKQQKKTIATNIVTNKNTNRLLVKIFSLMMTIREATFCALLFFEGIATVFAQSSTHDINTIEYKIITGQFEKGTPEQQEAYSTLFGDENIQFKFDFYFHWYNIAHEYGHCILDFNGKSIGGVKEEILANKYAVSYWKQAGFSNELAKLKEMLEKAIESIPNPVPESKTFVEWYTEIWGTPQLMTVPVYGYFQFKSVLIAMEEAENLSSWFAEAGIAGFTQSGDYISAKHSITSISASKYLNDMQKNLSHSGINIPNVEIELTDNPMIHCSKRMQQSH